MNIRRLPTAVSAVFVLFAAAMTGCTQNHTVADWQSATERYVAEQHNYDLAALADAQAREGHRVFKTLGDDRPDEGGDVVGLLVGQEVIDGQPWMLFVVGETEDRELQSSRLVAVTQGEGTGLRWAVGPANEHATQTYRRHQLIRHDGRTPYTGWPEAGDAYRLRVNDGTATVIEQRSGAVWLLRFDADEPEPAEDEPTESQEPTEQEQPLEQPDEHEPRNDPIAEGESASDEDS